jgi:uncharacterized membrane protein YidH (DUF202 family)
VTGGPLEQDLGDQVERTLLAWRRTALSLVVAGLLVGHLAVGDAGRPTLIATLAGVAAVVAFVWLSGGRRIGAAGLVLVAGVLLLGGLSLSGIVSR